MMNVVTQPPNPNPNIPVVQFPVPPPQPTVGVAPPACILGVRQGDATIDIQTVVTDLFTDAQGVTTNFYNVITNERYQFRLDLFVAEHRNQTQGRLRSSTQGPGPFMSDWHFNRADGVLRPSPLGANLGSVVNEANNAIAKAAMFVSSSKVLKGETTGGSYHGDSIKEGAGDMRHLIVEACLARNLIDTSAYFLATVCAYICNPLVKSINCSRISLVEIHGRSFINSDPYQCPHGGSCLKGSSKGPLLELLMRNLLLHAKMSDKKLEGSVASDILVNYNNMHKVLWEPFVEPWKCQMNIYRIQENSVLLNTEIMTDILVTSTAQLNLNVTESLFEVVLDKQNNAVTVDREVDGGMETLSLDLPAVITTDLRLNQPRYATLPNIMKAKSKPIKKYTPQELNVEIKHDIEIVQVCKPPKRKAGVKVSSVDELLDKLRNEARVI